MSIWFFLAAAFFLGLGILYIARPDIGSRILYGNLLRWASRQRPRPATKFQLVCVRIAGVCLIILGLVLLALPLLDYLDKLFPY